MGGEHTFQNPVPREGRFWQPSTHKCRLWQFSPKPPLRKRRLWQEDPHKRRFWQFFRARSTQATVLAGEPAQATVLAAAFFRPLFDDQALCARSLLGTPFFRAKSVARAFFSLNSCHIRTKCMSLCHIRIKCVSLCHIRTKCEPRMIPFPSRALASSRRLALSRPFGDAFQSNPPHLLAFRSVLPTKGETWAATKTHDDRLYHSKLHFERLYH